MRSDPFTQLEGRGARYGIQDETYDRIVQAVTIAHLEFEVCRHKDDINKLKEKLKTDRLSRNADMRAVEMKLRDAEAEVRPLRRRIKKLERDNDHLQRLLQQQSDKQNSERHKLKKNIEELKNELATTLDLLEDARRNLNKANASVKMYQDRLTEARKERRECNKLLASSLKSREDLQDDMSRSLRAKQAQLQNEIKASEAKQRESDNLIEHEASLRAAAEEAAKKIRVETRGEVDTLQKKVSKYVNKAKNRARKATKWKRKYDELEKKIEEDVQLLRPKKKLKPFEKLSGRQQRRRMKLVQELAGKAVRKLLCEYKMYVKGYGDIEIHGNVSSDDNVIKFRKGSPYSTQVGKFAYLHDHGGISKKKLHELHMACPVAPKKSDIDKRLKELNEEADATFDIESKEDSFHVHPEKTLQWIIKKRGLKCPMNKMDVIIEGDGSGLGNSFHFVILQMRIMEEGRKMFRNDRQYLLSLIKGKEDRKLMPQLLEPMLKKLKNIQSKGLEIKGERDVEVRHIDVRLHLVSDAKFMQVAGGTARFCDNTENCLFCLSSPEDREDETKWFRIDEKRYKHPIGQHGICHKDLFAFIPVERRWLEGMHLGMRFGHDKLIKAAWTEIITTEFDDEGEGLHYIESEMHRIGMTSFKFIAAKSKDDTAIGGWVYRSISYTDVVKILTTFNFKSGFRKNEKKGEIIDNIIKKWIRLYRFAFCTYPGDGPCTTPEDMFDIHSALYTALTAGDDVEPGEESESDFEDGAGSWPKHLIRTFYAHSWLCHVPDFYERSKAYARYFQDADDVEEEQNLNGGGLKPFRTDALERGNLRMFHVYFQHTSRRPKTVLHEAGYSQLRIMLNPDKTSRHTMWCPYCARGYVKRKYFEAHCIECPQAPVFEYTSYC